MRVSTSASGPIGVFDSGVGGLSVVRALWDELPHESLFYVGDTANCPYGPRGREEVRRLSEGIVRYLLDHGAKLIVVACNTASATALGHLRESFPQVPFVGMVPAIKPATAMTRRGVIGVLATQGTFRGHLYRRVVADFAEGKQIVTHHCPGLVERIEAGDTAGPDTVSLLEQCVAPMKAAGADVFVLGCTHYPFVIPALQQILGDEAQIIEPSAAVARQARRMLVERGLLTDGDSFNGHRFVASGDPVVFQARLRHLLGHNGTVQAVRWDSGRLIDP